MLKFFVFSLCFLTAGCMFSNDAFCAKNEQQQEETNPINPTIDGENISDKKSEEGEIEEVSCEKILERETANMRMIQLAKSIADDMGLIMKVSMNN